jgi:hypothetical protein
VWQLPAAFQTRICAHGRDHKACTASKAAIGRWRSISRINTSSTHGTSGLLSRFPRRRTSGGGCRRRGPPKRRQCSSSMPSPPAAQGRNFQIALILQIGILNQATGFRDVPGLPTDRAQEVLLAVGKQTPVRARMVVTLSPESAPSCSSKGKRRHDVGERLLVRCMSERTADSMAATGSVPALRWRG